MKKLWERSKSRLRGGQRERESSVAGKTPGATKETTTSHNAWAIPPVPAWSPARATSPEVAQPGSDSKVQPVLIGISRPNAVLSRPGTAGSLQNAINQAADKVAQSASSDFKDHTRTTSTKSSRYVDIFAIQNPKSSKATYNEDVAERNIDVKKVAEDDVHYRYVPKSKYQEEVATRNAHGHSQSADGINYEDLPPRPEVPRSQSAMGPAYSIAPHRLADADDIRRLHHAQLAALRRPQGRNTNDSATHPASLVTEERQPRSMPHTVDQQGQTDASVQHRQHHATTSLNMVAASSPLPNYQLSQSEMQQRETDFRSQARPFEQIQTVTQHPDNNDRSMSLVSNASSTRRAINLQNRTIMDLTVEDEDFVTNGQSGSDLSKSTVLQQVHVDSMPRVQPKLIASGGQVEQGKVDERASQQKQAKKETSASNANLVTEKVTSDIHPPSTFSSINTIASVSPTIQLNGEPVSPPKSGNRGKLTNLYTVTESEPETEEFQAPAEAAAQHVPNLNTAVVDQKISASSSDLTTTSSRPPSSPTSVETPRQTETAESTPRKIQLSPESLQSRDFTEPSRAFGVTARDFAVTPTKPSSMNRSDREPNTSAKVTHPRVAVANGDTVRSIENFIPESTADSLPNFDEEKFRRKQEQARAALIRLQQSLNEEFNPPQRTVKQAKGTDNRDRAQSNTSNTSNDGKGVNSTSIFSQVRDYPANRPQTNGIVQPRSSSAKHSRSTQDRPSSSSRPRTAAGTTTVKPTRRLISPSTQPKGKGRDLDSALAEMARLADEMRNPRFERRPAPPPPPPAPPVPALPSQPQPFVPKQNGMSNRNSASTNNSSGSEILPSPGEVSLSSFPPPASVQHSRDTSLNLPIQKPADITPPGTNRNSFQPVLYKVKGDDDEDGAPPPVISVATPPRQLASHSQRHGQISLHHHHQQKKSSSSQPRPALPTPQPHPQPLSSHPASTPQSPPPERKANSRRGSMHSQASVKTSSSQYSIPYHLIPERVSSMRDSIVREVDGED